MVPTTLNRPGVVVSAFDDDPLFIPMSEEWTTLVSWTASALWSRMDIFEIVQATLVVENAATVKWRIVPSQTGIYGDTDQASILTRSLTGEGEQSMTWDNRLKRYFKIEAQATDQDAFVYFEVSAWLISLSDLSVVGGD